MIFNILMSLVTQVLSNKTKYSPNEDDQQNDSANAEPPRKDKAGSTSTSPLPVEE